MGISIYSTGEIKNSTLPAFSAYLSSNQTISSGNVFNKINCNTEHFDTNSNYDNATNYRFTPNVAGYYQVNAGVSLNNAYLRGFASIYKNGAEFARGVDVQPTSNSYGYNSNTSVSSLVYLNGSTDYIELYFFSGSTTSIAGGQALTYFNAILVRAV